MAGRTAIALRDEFEKKSRRVRNLTVGGLLLYITGGMTTPRITSSVALQTIGAVSGLTLLFVLVRLWKEIHSPYVVVWLRRFDRPDAQKVRNALLRETQLLTNLVTLQDLALPRSARVGGSGCLAYSLVAGITFTVIQFPFLGLLMSMPLTGRNVLLAFSVPPFVAAIILFFIRRGTRPIRVMDRSDLTAVGRRLDSYRDERGMPGISVVNASDTHWKDVVTRLLETADAVIVDVAELSEAIRWEIEQAVDKIGPGSLIILYRSASSQDLREALRQEFGDYAWQWLALSDVKRLRSVLTTAIAARQ